MSEKKVLVIGGGGREHALVSAICRSPQNPKVYCAPGNAGIAAEAECVPIGSDSADDLQRLVEFAKSESIDLTIVGPEVPLVLGIVDLFQREDLKIFGPPGEGAQLEGSKIFCKEFLDRNRIPTAPYEIFDDADAALQHIEERDAPMVVKADGLAAGKGVIVARDKETARDAIRSIMVDKNFGAAGDRVIIEDCLTGSEISVMIVTDGTSYVPLETAQDYKPAFDGNEGPNTGGMGAYSPYYRLGDPTVQQIIQNIVRRTVDGLSREGLRFHGILYAGVMLTADGPQTLEYNVRFGDPETQPILSRLRSDIVALFEAACEEDGLSRVSLDWDPRPAVCVVATSAGYPGSYEKGQPINGLDAANAIEDVSVYHAGTKLSENGECVTSGGRVLGVTALGVDRDEARARAYEALGKIHFDGLQHRNDIGETMRSEAPRSEAPRSEAPRSEAPRSEASSDTDE
jgi:phosphoribosylamine--glycine ligase